MSISMRSLLLATVVAAVVASAAPAGAQDAAADAPHLLDCTVKNTVHLTQDGTLATDPPLPAGARAIGRVTEFVVDLATAVVRLPGRGTIAWIPAKGDPQSSELILTPVSALDSATTISIHIYRKGDYAWFLFFETERVMTGTCSLLPAS